LKLALKITKRNKKPENCFDSESLKKRFDGELKGMTTLSKFLMEMWSKIDGGLKVLS
jgi:hypothetical protein